MCPHDLGTCHRAGSQWVLGEPMGRGNAESSLLEGVELAFASSHPCQVGRDSTPVILSVAACPSALRPAMTCGTCSTIWPPAPPPTLAGTAAQLCTLPRVCVQVCTPGSHTRGPEQVCKARPFRFPALSAPLISEFLPPELTSSARVQPVSSRLLFR